MYDNNINQSNSSDVESCHEEMDWYHVLKNHKTELFLRKELKNTSFKE